MFYEEKVINGVLCSRGTPTGEWTPKTPEQLTQLLLDARRTRDGLAKGELFAHY